MSGKADHIRILEDLPKLGRRILELEASGMNLKGIGARLGFTVQQQHCSGIEYHMAKLIKTTGLRTVAERTRLAVRLGVADINP